MVSNQEKDNHWKEQYERIRRWYEKTRKVDYYENFRNKEYHNDKEIWIDLLLHQNSITDEGLDIYYTFFINCYHLKDWLLHSKVLPNKEILDEFFHRDEYMRICHIVCTGSKHLKIDNNKILDPKDKYGTRVEYDPSRPNSEKDGSVKTRLIYINGKTYDLMDLAKDCMQAVDNFLYMNNLLELDK